MSWCVVNRGGSSLLAGPSAFRPDHLIRYQQVFGSSPSVGTPWQSGAHQVRRDEQDVMATAPPARFRIGDEKNTLRL